MHIDQPWLLNGQTINGWDVNYTRAINDDGTLFFPERLSHEVLMEKKRTMGSYLFANQYQNEIIPLEDAPFKMQWLKYYDVLPKKNYHRFFFIDPALSTSDGADYTACVGVLVSSDQTWYVTHAARKRITPTQIVDLVFDLHKHFKPQAIGIESVAYQKALIYMVAEEMKRRGQIVPLKDVLPPSTKSKEARILGLVPRFEWGRVFISRGLYDFEKEYSQFPRASHDDIIDALAQIEQVVIYPQPEKEEFLNGKAPPNNHPDYERWFIHNKLKASRDGEESTD